MALPSRTVAAAVSAEAGPEVPRNPDRARRKTSAKARALAKDFRKDIRSRYRWLVRLVPSIRMWRYQWSAPGEVRHSGLAALLSRSSDPIVRRPCGAEAESPGKRRREEKFAMKDPVDVLIIGAGASGAAVAWSLAETKMHILCLEQGGWMNPAEYPSTGRDWEAKFYGEWSSSPNVRGRPEDYPINDDDSPIKVVNYNAVGGSTVMYTAHWPRLHPSDFKVRTLAGVADDCPIDYDALPPFFEENDRMMGTSGLSGDPLSPLTHPPMPQQPMGLSGAIVGKTMNKLGWHWWPSDTTVATMDYEGRARCINLGHCTPACAQGAKASTDITYWPHAIRAGVELRTHCRVREITTNEHGMASGVVYYDKDGVEQFQAAEVVIIACNGIGTPRLLLNSVSGRFPNGIANSSGLVGRNLMFHPFAHTYGYVDEPIDGNTGAQLSLWSQEFYETDKARGFVRGYTLQLHRGAGMIVDAIANTARGFLPWGEAHHDVYRGIFNRKLGLS